MSLNEENRLRVYSWSILPCQVLAYLLWFATVPCTSTSRLSTFYMHCWCLRSCIMFVAGVHKTQKPGTWESISAMTARTQQLQACKQLWRTRGGDMHAADFVAGLTLRIISRCCTPQTEPNNADGGDVVPTHRISTSPLQKEPAHPTSRYQL
jgi:hypothetical protein